MCTIIDMGWPNVIRPKQNCKMCPVKIESGLGYKSVPSPSPAINGLESGLQASQDSSTTSLHIGTHSA